jgi:WD40 repeat protein
VTASADRSLKVWSAEDGRLRRSFSHHTEAVHAVVFRPRTKAAGESPVQCASASDDATVRIWQPGIGRMVRIVRHHEGPVFALAYTPEGDALYSAGKEGVIRRIDTESDEILGQWKGHNEPVYRIVISPDGKHLASGDWAGKVQLWRISGGWLQKL